MTAQARLLGGRYQVGELLGYGGMAEVHRGRDLRLGRDVAIKMLRTDLARDATFQERFRREAQNAAALNHPAIVAVYDTGEEVSSTGEKLPFIVMEFVNGRTLKEVLAAEQRMQPRRALEIIADICAALEFSHRHGIIHRDIKPGNVMLTQNGQVKVMDFGIARALASGASTMTQTSAVIGTAQYLSPEQARGEAVDARSDVYAAGCVLFELLVGHPPFVGDSPVSVAYQHVREDPRAPSDINREVPPEVDAIVLKALSKNPLNRYQSAQEMRADALRAVAGRPVLATPVMNEAETMAMTGGLRPPPGGTRPVSPGGLPPAPPPRRRSNWVAAAIAAVAVLAIVVTVVALVQAADRDPPAPTSGAVPNLIGKSPAEAVALLRAQKFTSSQQGPPDTSADCEKGKVSKQEPAPDATAPFTTVVSYSVCTGPAQVPVPDLRGNTKEQAERTLRGLRLKADFEEVDSTKDEGIVVRNDKANQTVDADSTIKVYVSKGNRLAVIDVVGKPEDEARTLLEDRGFNVEVESTSQARTGTTPGTVVAQDPDEGEERSKGSKVTITVYRPDPFPSGSPDPNGSQPPIGQVPGQGGQDDNGLPPGILD